MLTAYKRSDGWYELEGSRSSDTFNIRRELKELGGKWDGHRWLVAESVLILIKAQKMYEVLVEAHCHEEEGIRVCNESEALSGYLTLGCSRCDRSFIGGDRVKILKVLGEPVVKVKAKV